MYEGHYQPRIPADLGFYDLRLKEIQIEQAELAKAHGIYGFCYYYYWFTGRRLLEAPLEAMLSDSRVAMPYCLCWANENWTRRWDGQDDLLLMAQHYSAADDRAFARSLTPHFKDPRYIRVAGKPLLLIYRTSLFPDIKASVKRWREIFREEGIGEVYLVRAEIGLGDPSPADIDFDAAYEFPPHPFTGDDVPVTAAREGFLGRVKDYALARDYYRLRPRPAYPLFRGVFPSWDNTPRRMEAGLSYIGSSPEEYKKWLSFAVRDTLDYNAEPEHFVFINAWNEWGEGAHLEPCLKHGRGYLEATWEASSAVATSSFDEELAGAIPINFVLEVAEGNQWAESCAAFVDAFPRNFSTRLYLKVPVLNHETKNWYSEVLFRRGITAEGILLASGNSVDKLNGFTVFVGHEAPQVADFRYWWFEAAKGHLKAHDATWRERLLQAARSLFARF
jgi:hypothetical protein